MEENKFKGITTREMVNELIRRGVENSDRAIKSHSSNKHGDVLSGDVVYIVDMSFEFEGVNR